MGQSNYHPNIVLFHVTRTYVLLLQEFDIKMNHHINMAEDTICCVIFAKVQTGNILLATVPPSYLELVSHNIVKCTNSFPLFNDW